MATITIDPVNRIEGHLKVEVTCADTGTGIISDAKCTGNLFRGFELIMNKRDPRDAPVIVQRI
jgi:hydrogenase large subunit